MVLLKWSSRAELILDEVSRELLQSLDFSSQNDPQEFLHHGRNPNFIIQGIIHDPQNYNGVGLGDLVLNSNYLILADPGS